MVRVILASTSPRRKALLEQIGLTFDVVAPDYEEIMDAAVRTTDLAGALALGKARAVAKHRPDDVVIGADTFIAFEGALLGKPLDAEDAAAALARLSGQTHTVVTGFAVVHATSGTEYVESVESTVTMRTLSDREIDAYVATGEPLDKAGSYALQGKGAVLVDRVDGDVSAIIGLPLAPLAHALRRFGVDVL